MSDASAPKPSSAEPKPRTLWQRRITDPIVAQLTQGLTPEKIALTIAVGSSIAMFPILGTTTLICLAVGVVMKLNQPIIQAVNYACTPIHIPFLYYSFVWGDRLFGDSHTRLQFKKMMAVLREHPLDFVATYSVTALHAVIVWAILVPFWSVTVYYLSLSLLRTADRVRRSKLKSEPAA